MLLPETHDRHHRHRRSTTSSPSSSASAPISAPAPVRAATPVPPHRPDGPATEFRSTLRVVTFFLFPTSTPRPRPHHGRDFFWPPRYRRPFAPLHPSMRRRRCRALPCQSAFGRSGKPVGAAVRRRQDRQARRRRGAVPGRRSGRRLLSGRAGPAQGHHDRGTGAERILAIVGPGAMSANSRPSTGCRARHRSPPSAIPN